MNDMISKMNDVLAAWKEEFKIMDIQQKLFFSVDAKGVLCFNDFAVCHVSDLILERSRYDLNVIVFYFDNNRSLTLNVYWPEDDAPYVYSATFSCLFYPVEQ